MAIHIRIARTAQDRAAVFHVRTRGEAEAEGRRPRTSIDLDPHDTFEHTCNLLISQDEHPVGCLRLTERTELGLPFENRYGFPTVLPHLRGSVMAIDHVQILRSHRGQQSILMAALKVAVQVVRSRGASHLLAWVGAELGSLLNRIGLATLSAPQLDEARGRHFTPLYARVIDLRSAFVEWGQHPLYEMLGASLHRSIYCSGEAICHEGDAGDSAYLVARGSVCVTRKDGSGREVLIDILGPGELFGELALLDPGPRSATVRAYARECDLAVLERDAFRELVLGHPQRTEATLRLLARRIRGSSSRLAALQPQAVVPLLTRVLCDAARSALLDQEGLLEGATLEWLAGQVGRPPSLVQSLLDVLERRELLSWTPEGLYLHSIPDLQRCLTDADAPGMREEEDGSEDLIDSTPSSMRTWGQ